MKYLLIFFCIIFVHVQGWTGIIEYDPAQALLGDCYTTTQNLGAFQKGQVKRLKGQCAIATCTSSGDITITGCGVVAVSPPYKVVPGDLSKPYPKCCNKIIGPDKKTTNVID